MSNYKTVTDLRATFTNYKILVTLNYLVRYAKERKALPCFSDIINNTFIN